MSSTGATPLNHALLRPAIIQILRAVGFHGAKPSVIDALTDVSARYMILLASRTVSWAQESHNSSVPDISDVRMALTDCGLLGPTLQGSEEVWREILRRPLEEISERNGLRMMEKARRDQEDTEDVQAFVDWFQGGVIEELARITGHANAHGAAQNAAEKQTDAGAEGTEDYLAGGLTGQHILHWRLLMDFSAQEEAQQDGRGVQVSGHCLGDKCDAEGGEDRGRACVFCRLEGLGQRKG